MSSVDIFIVVEGQSEQTFVREVLAPEMAPKGLYLYPALLGRPGHKGGDVKFDRAMVDIGKFLKQRPDSYVSTMFDYFRIHHEWPGKFEIHSRIRNGETLSATNKADILERKTKEEMRHSLPRIDLGRRFIPYISMHEFEALLFSDGRILSDKTGIGLAEIQRIMNRFSNPEEINDDPAAAPSKRLSALNSGYRKVAMGTAITRAIGIRSIRSACPHFDDWLSKLERLTEDIRA